MDLRETYNLIAEEWHRDHSIDDWWKEGTDTFIKMLPRGAHVLDVGCGGGVKAKYLLNHGLAVTGIDISDKLLEIARREAPKGEFKELSMYNLDLMTEAFDGAFAQASLLHIAKKDADDIVKKMATRLVPGGLLYIAVKEIREGKPEEEIIKERDYGVDFERFFSYFTIAELERFLSNAKLEAVLKFRNQSTSGKTVWLQIIGRK